MSATKSYDEIIDFIAAGTTPETVVAFSPSESVQERVAALVERSKDGTITSEEQSELEDYLQLEHIMIMAKARARRHTRLAELSRANPSAGSSRNERRTGVNTASCMKTTHTRRIGSITSSAANTAVRRKWTIWHMLAFAAMRGRGAILARSILNPGSL